MVSRYVGKSEAKTFKFLATSPVDSVARYTGIGLLTNAYFNSITTAKTDSGEENLVQFASPYINKIPDIEKMLSDEEILSDRISGAVSVLKQVEKTKLFTDKDKIGVVNNGIKKAVPEVPELPSYKKFSDIVDDLDCAGDIVEVVEGLGVDLLDTEKLNKTKITDLRITDYTISQITDSLYSMHEAEYYAQMLLAYALDIKDLRLSTYVSFESTRYDFETLLECANDYLRMKREGNYDYYDLYNLANRVEYTNILDESTKSQLLSRFMP